MESEVDQRDSGLLGKVYDMKIVATDMKYQELLEAAEDMATALIELNPDSKFAQKVIQRFEEVRDGH